MSKKITADFRFIQNRLVHLDVDNHELYIIEKESKGFFDVDYKITSIDEHDDLLIGIIEMHISCGLKNKDDVEQIKVNLIMEGGFSADKELGKERFEQMLSINGVSTLYSICRSYIINVTAVSYDGTPMRLPMINVLALNQKKEDERKNKSEDK